MEDKPNALEFTLKLPVSGLKSTEEENDTLTLEHPIQISINGIITFLTPEAVISRPSAIKHSIDTITANLSFIQVKKNLEIKHPLGVYPQASIPELNSPYAVNTPARMQAYKLKDLIINNETAGYQNKSEVGELMFIAGWVAKAIAIKYNG